MFTKST